MMSAETLAYRNGVVKVNADSQFLILRHRQCKSAGERAPATEEEEIQYQGLKEHGQRRWQREAEYLSAAVWLALQLTVALAVERIGTDCEIRCLHLFYIAAVKLGFLELDGAFSFCTYCVNDLYVPCIFMYFLMNCLLGCNQYIDKKHESIQNATTNKKADSDSEEEGRDLEKNDRHLKQEERALLPKEKILAGESTIDDYLLKMYAYTMVVCCACLLVVVLLTLAPGRSQGQKEITGLISYRCCNCSRYENAREEEKLRRKPEDFIDVVAELLHLIFISYKPTILSLLLIT
ncbi:uncharacterized protein HKW66_Vig0007950 [Vigna angularis]|uniref:Uncharacterized protein n=1 Tax=Phaseolus angularis TaxID=3914 RepID=A0A8T0LBG3_PHAAN|nr:uncharacterized protein HKW66_Vig0007950 [Vigna angularis]